MKSRFYFGFIFALIVVSIGCRRSDSTQTGLSIVATDSLLLIPSKGLVFYKNQPFTGISRQKYPTDTIAETITYQAGLRFGENKKYFPNGLISYLANYENGKLQGTAKSWWKNGNIRSESNYDRGKVHGVQTEWYQEGQKFKVQHFVKGQEEGMQTAWRQNGKIYNNYEAKNGRIFGLKRANLCYELKDEEVQYKD